MRKALLKKRDFTRQVQQFKKKFEKLESSEYAQTLEKVVSGPDLMADN